MFFKREDIMIFSHTKGPYGKEFVIEIIHEKTALKVKGAGTDFLELKRSLEFELYNKVYPKEEEEE